MDLRYAGRALPSLAALDEDGIVVQLLSFSKSLFPGVRAGAMVARGRQVEALLALRHAADLGGSLPLQAALADFVRSGAYDRHLAAQRKRLRARRDALLAASRTSCRRARRWTEPEGGFQVWLELPEPLDSRDSTPTRCARACSWRRASSSIAMAPFARLRLSICAGRRGGDPRGVRRLGAWCANGSRPAPGGAAPRSRFEAAAPRAVRRSEKSQRKRRTSA